MKAILRSGFLALAIMALAVPANAGPLEDGVAAYYRDDYATALKYWRPLAEKGDAIAQNGLGFMYENGEGVPQDNATAVKWYRMAAEQDFALAQSKLGFDGSATKPKAVISPIGPKRVKTIKIIGPDDPLEPQQFNLGQQAK